MHTEHWNWQRKTRSRYRTCAERCISTISRRLSISIRNNNWSSAGFPGRVFLWPFTIHQADEFWSWNHSLHMPSHSVSEQWEWGTLQLCMRMKQASYSVKISAIGQLWIFLQLFPYRHHSTLHPESLLSCWSVSETRYSKDLPRESRLLKRLWLFKCCLSKLIHSLYDWMDNMLSCPLELSKIRFCVLRTV